MSGSYKLWVPKRHSFTDEIAVSTYMEGLKWYDKHTLTRCLLLYMTINRAMLAQVELPLVTMLAQVYRNLSSVIRMCIFTDGVPW